MEKWRFPGIYRLEDGILALTFREARFGRPTALGDTAKSTITEFYRRQRR